MIEVMHGCEVCYKLYDESRLVAVERCERVFPWYICKPCAEKISDALLAKVVQDCTKKHEDDKPLTEGQKHYIKIFVDGKCTDGYLMTKLGIFDWKDAQRLIERYKKEEAKNE